MHAPAYPTDLTAPGAIEQLLTAHRHVFGTFRMEETGEAGGDGSQETPPSEEQQQTQPADKGFPADTPVAEMSADQQVAYWKDKARKHEQRANSRSDYDDLKARAARLEQIEREHESEQDKAVREAREAGATDARTAVQQETTAAMARMALRARGVKDEEITSFVNETNLSVFVNDEGQVDDERLLARVEKYADTASSTSDWPDTGRRGGGDGRPERRTGEELRKQYLRR